MTYEIAQYLHCSYQGSYYIPCVIVQKNVPFSVEEHGSDLDKVFGFKDEQQGLRGHLINYRDPISNKFEYSEWVPAKNVKYNE